MKPFLVLLLLLSASAAPAADAERFAKAEANVRNEFNGMSR